MEMPPTRMAILILPVIIRISAERLPLKIRKPINGATHSEITTKTKRIK